MSDITRIAFTATEQLLIGRFARMAQWCAAFAVLFGLAMLAPWLGPSSLFSANPDAWLPKANTAMCLVACGAGLALGVDRSATRRWRITQGLAVFAGAIAALTLAEYATGLNLRIDTLLISDHSPEFPGRMAPQTAGAFLLFAVAIFCADRQQGLASNLCDGAIVGIGMLLHAVLSGYFFHDVAFTGISTGTRMSPLTLVALSVLWTGMLFQRADAGLFRILSGEGRGSQVIRYLMPPTILMPVLLASIRLWAEVSGLEASSLWVTGFATAQSLFRIMMIVGLGYLLNRSEAQRREEKARREQAERMVAMCAWTQRVRWNGEWVAVDQFLKERFDIEITHGISEDALEEQLKALDLGDDGSMRRVA